MNHRPRKRFGQNFLHDRAVIDRIVAAVGPSPGDTLVEIGPGRGALTGPLLQAAGALTVVEIDRDLAALLRDRHGADPGFSLHEADALGFDFSALGPAPGPQPGCPEQPRRRVRVVGNLPYNISTPLLFHLLAQRECIQDMHFMLQREVVNRLVAGPGSKAYGRLGVMVQLDCEAEPLFNVGPGAFTPAPRVTSAVVRLQVRTEPAAEVDDRNMFADLVRHLFSQRRKSLRASLKGRLDAATIESVEVDPGARPESLGLSEFARLANAMSR